MKKSSKRYASKLCAAILCLLAVGAALSLSQFHSQAQSPSYNITDLGTLAGTNSAAYGINQCGQIVGGAPPDGTPRHPFLINISGNQVTDLGTLGGSSGTANAINASGYVAGTARVQSEEDHAFLWNGVSEQDLAPNSNAVAFALNDNGRVVGTIDTSPAGSNDLSNSAFTWDSINGLQIMPAQTTTIGTTMAPLYASGINNGGSIVGVGQLTSGSQPSHAFISKNGLLTDLGTLGGTRSWAFNLSESESVVGYASIPGDAAFHAFIWKDANNDSISNAGELKDLTTLGGSNSIAYDVNSSGDVVGTSDVSGGASHAFIYQSNQMKDLNSLIGSHPEWTLAEARSINDAGYIVGFGTLNGQTHAFLLSPANGSLPSCPTPTPTPTPSVSVAVSPASVAEDGAQNLVYTFTRSGGSNANSLTINFSVGGNAIFSSDYTQSGAGTFTTSSGLVVIGAGNSSATVTIDPTTDSTVEPDETVVLTVVSGSGYSVGSPSAATGTILNDDTDVTVGVSPSSVTESGATNLIYTFTRTGVTSGSMTVNFSVGGTATFGSDYSQTGAATFSSTNGTVTIPAGNPSANVIIDPAVDGVVDNNETVILTVTSGAGYNVGGANSATGTITDTPTIYTTDGVNAAAIDSVTFAAGPFHRVNEHNFSSDQVTRVILITSPLGITQQNPPASTVAVHISGYPTPLPIENVGPITGVPGFNGSYIVVQLPQDLWTLLIQNQPKTDLMVTVTLGNATSNTALLSIAP